MAARAKRRKQRARAAALTPRSEADLERGLLIPVLSRIFEELAVGASLWHAERWPELIHDQPSVAQFEQQFGVAAKRYAYNDRCLAEGRRTLETVVGEHA